MKQTILMVGVLLSLTGNGWASETYSCESSMPRGHASVTIESSAGKDTPSTITMRFHNDALGAAFDGSFDVTYFDPVLDDAVQADGVFLAGKSRINASIQGSLKAVDGSVVLTVYASGDHRIEYGYGLWLECSKTGAAPASIK
jgi:hypothetical protein